MHDVQAGLLTEAERAELLGWVSACQSAYCIDSTPSHAFHGLPSNLEENRSAVCDFVNELLEARATAAGPAIDALVERFLAWPVPASVYPDGTPGKPGRSGTNLLSAAEAREMFVHVLGQGVPASQG